jgi:hypothetical protein
MTVQGRSFEARVQQVARGSSALATVCPASVAMGRIALAPGQPGA